MASRIEVLEARGGSLVPPAAQRGYYIMYREHDTNWCPGCGRSHWHIGRMLAEWWQPDRPHRPPAPDPRSAAFLRGLTGAGADKGAR